MLQRGRLPFPSVPKGLVATEDVKSHEDRLEAIGRQTSRADCYHQKDCPSPGCVEPLLGGAVKNCFDSQQSGHRQSEGEASVNVCPKRHEREEHGIWQSLAFDGPHQACEPDNQERVCEDLRSRRKMTQGKNECCK